MTVPPKHRGFQVFSDLDEPVYAALKESIAARGVLVPIVIDQHNGIIDGHNRARAAAELGVECPTVTVPVENHRDGRDIALLLNTVRRHLDVEQRRQVVADLRTAGHSLRAIAGAVGVDPKTVRNDLAGGDTSPPERSTGADGKSYPARRPTPPAPPAAVPEPDVCTVCGEVDPPGFSGTYCQDCWQDTEVSDERFEAAVGAAHADGDLSRENVRKHTREPEPAAAAAAPQPKRRPETVEERAGREAQQRREDNTRDVATSLANLYASLMVPKGAELTVDGWQPDIARHFVLLFPDLLTSDGIRRVAGMLDHLADVWPNQKEVAA